MENREETDWLYKQKTAYERRMSDWSSDVCSSDLIAAVQKIVGEMIPALGHLHAALDAKAQAFEKIIKIGRTHLMDATPLTLGQKLSGYAPQVPYGITRLETANQHLLPLDNAGPAVRTGLNASAGFALASASQSPRPPPPPS